MSTTAVARDPTAPDLFGHRKYWAHRLTPAPFLPMSREEMDLLGWDQCDVILVTGDAYVDHPSFGMAIIGRLLEAQGFRVGIIAQPDWRSADAFGRIRIIAAHALVGRVPVDHGVHVAGRDSEEEGGRS